MDNIIIRQDKYKEYEAITALHTLAFGQPAEGYLVELLRDSKAFIAELSLVAVKDGSVVGHILFSKISIRKTKDTSVEVLALSPMAVLPTLQQQGIGSLLVLEGLKRASKLPYPGVIVLGHEHYYHKFGFEPASKWGIICPYPEVEDEHWMALELKPEGLTNARGLAQYSKEFNALG